jgi:hypothetical protein
VIDALKTAFVHGRLTSDELGARAGRALAARTGAELAALTADIPAEPAASGLGQPSPPVRDQPLVRAAAGSATWLTIACAAFWLAAHLDNPVGPSPDEPWIPLCLVVAFAAAITALLVFGYGAGAAAEQRRSRRPAHGPSAKPDLPGRNP